MQLDRLSNRLIGGVLRYDKLLDKYPIPDYNLSIRNRILNVKGDFEMNGHIKHQLEMINQQEKELISIYRYISTQFGISESEFWVLYALFSFKGECSQQNICDMWFLPKQTVNSVVASLTKKGYVFLETVPGTRNRKNIRMTEAGMKFGKNTVLSIYDAEQRALAKMSEQERQECIALLGKYITFLREEIDESFYKDKGE